MGDEPTKLIKVLKSWPFQRNEFWCSLVRSSVWVPKLTYVTARNCVRGGKSDDRGFLLSRVISTSIFLKGVTAKLTFWVYIWLIEMMYHLQYFHLPFGELCSISLSPSKKIISITTWIKPRYCSAHLARTFTYEEPTTQSIYPTTKHL